MTDHRSSTPSLGIITYDFFHLKTEQVVHRLLRKGYRNMTIFALPFEQRPERAVAISHRPKQTDAIRTEELAAANNLNFVRYDGKSALSECDFYLVTGAGILPPAVVKDKKIINAHPGIIPAARGLDSFKWSIHDGVPLGVTLHYIDEQVDSGEIITIVNTPVYAGDTLLTLARRHYELEIDIISDFAYHLSNPSVERFPTGEAHRRMPSDTEAEMANRFDAYKAKFANRAPANP